MLYFTKSRVLNSEKDESAGAKVLKFDPSIRQRRPAAEPSEGSKKARLISKIHSNSKPPKNSNSGSSKGSAGKKAKVMGSGSESWGSVTSQYHGGRSGGASMAKPSIKGSHHRHVARKAHGSHPVRLWAARAVLFVAMVFVMALVFRGCIPGI